MGRRCLDLGVEPWGDNPVYHAPCFVLSHHAQERIVKEGGTTFTFVTAGIESALKQRVLPQVTKTSECLRGQTLIVTANLLVQRIARTNTFVS